MPPPNRHVSSRLVLDVLEPARLALLVAVARPDAVQLTETLTVTHEGAVVPAEELAVPDGERIHQLLVPAGRVVIEYAATVRGQAAERPVTALDELRYLRPSRYAESDRLVAIAHSEFGRLTGEQLLPAVSSWVGARLDYVPGSSTPTDGAVDTLLAGRGVCRDYAHLVTALLRALDVPARLVAVYAPGLWPMDFHAVVEAAVDGRWRVVDATLLAPRASLVRIATGRDAADTAFLSNYGGRLDLVALEVTATVDGNLPNDDVTALLSLG